MRRTARRIAGPLLVVVGLVGCGGGSNSNSPQGPTAAAPSPPHAWLAGTTVSVVSGEDLAPVEGAQVTIGTSRYVTDGAGQIVLGEDAPYGAFVDVVADGFLARQTFVPRQGGARFVLWPRDTASGMTERFTAQIVYTYGWSSEPDHGTSPLTRLPEGEREVFVWISGELQNDFLAERTHRDAVEEMTATLEGRAVYVFSTTRPSSGVVIEARLGTPEDGCHSGYLAFFQASRSARGEITGGRIFYCDPEAARTSTVLHELGHSAGLQHTYDSDELMGKNRWRLVWFTGLAGVEHHFNEREALAMKLLFERPAGNLFPDSDREVGASAGGVYTTFCD